MRTVVVGLAVLVWLGLATSANAERRIFIVANDADGYGIDRCLASGERCGAAVANAYCKTQAFAQASTYHKVDRGDVTGASQNNTSTECRDNICNVIAIVCTR
jgi:hypothetical protein